jgi:hypothetical protein
MGGELTRPAQSRWQLRPLAFASRAAAPCVRHARERVGEEAIVMQLAVEYRRRPSALLYMARAFHRPRPDVPVAFPPLRLAWRDVRAQPRDLADFAALTGLRAADALSPLFLHVIAFRLQMASLTHPAWPLPIWRALQVRNRITQHRPFALDERFDLETGLAGARVQDKGLEVDLRTVARTGGAIRWESVVTFYYRGQFGPADPASPLAQAPDPGGDEVARWCAGAGCGLRFGRLTGDYNGIHLWSPYARLSGFPRAFHHPQRVLGQCLARLDGPPAREPQRIEAWLKGPVGYGSQVVLRARCDVPAIAFGLFADGDARPAISGRWVGLS